MVEVPPLRIGQGYDLHRFCAGRKLFLGGVEIPFEKGLAGHSDADALLHAVTDALLGALALGDIGEWFPDTDPAYQGADSRKLLQKVLAAPEFASWKILNLDCTIFTELPKLTPWKGEIRRSLAALLQISENAVSVKAKTNEKEDAIGRGEALAASATVLLQQRGNAVWS